MRTGRMLWLIIIMKPINILGFLKPLFYTDTLYSHFGSDGQRATYVLDNLTFFPEKKTSMEGR